MYVDLSPFGPFFSFDTMLKYSHPIENQLAMSGEIHLYTITSSVLTFFNVRPSNIDDAPYLRTTNNIFHMYSLRAYIRI